MRKLAVGLVALAVLPLGASAQEKADTYEQPCAAQYNKALYPDLNRLAPPEAPAATRSALRAVVVRTLTWKPGELIKVCFRSGTQAARERVAKHASEWMRYANVKLEFGEPGNLRTCKGDNHEGIKVDFIDAGPKSGFWSALGTLSRNDEHSLNLSFLGRDNLPVNREGQSMPEAEARRLILHEFGHALGLLHEHQSPKANCGEEYYEEAVMAYGALRGWPREQTIRNFKQYSEAPELNTSEVDRKSIMHYSLPSWLFKSGEKSACFVQTNFEISARDKEFMARVYPAGAGNRPVASAGSAGAPAPTVTRSAAAAQDPAAEYAALLQKSGLPKERIDALVAEFKAGTK